MPIDAEDVDGDGLSDVIVWSPMTYEVAVLHGTGAPSSPFTPPTHHQPELATRPGPGLAAAETWPDLVARDVDGDSDIDLTMHLTRDSGVRYLASGERAFAPGAVHGGVPEVGPRENARSRERWDSAQLDVRGRLHVTSPQWNVALEPGTRRPSSGRRRIPTPFAADSAVYADFTVTDRYGFGTLVIGAGARLASQGHRSEPNHWRVIRLR